MRHIEIYTDGSCLKNPGFGGWAYILRYNQHQKKVLEQKLILQTIEWN